MLANRCNDQMNSKIFLLLLSVAVYAMRGATNQAAAQDKDFHIYLSFGQSNMEGHGRFEDQDTLVNDRFLALQAVTCNELDRKIGTWFPAKPPITRCNTGLTPAD